jgi:hypothetical protein
MVMVTSHSEWPTGDLFTYTFRLPLLVTAPVPPLYDTNRALLEAFCSWDSMFVMAPVEITNIGLVPHIQRIRDDRSVLRPRPRLTKTPCEINWKDSY